MIHHHDVSYTSVQRFVNGQPIIRLCTILHYSWALFPYFTATMYTFSCCIFLILQFPFCTFFILHSFYILHYFMLHFCVLQSFRLAFFSCCTVNMLHFFPVALFPEVQPWLPQRVRVLQQQLRKSLTIAAKLSILDVYGGPGYVSIFMLHFSYCNLLTLKNIKKEATITYNQHLNFFEFWYPVTHPVTNLLFCWKRMFNNRHY